MAIDTTGAMSPEKIKSLIKSELPILIQNDPEIQAFIMKLAEQRFADKKQTKGRIEQLIEELKRDREEDRRKWEDAKQEDRRQMGRG
jgi:tRNA(Phe) wybutosine-synthesizing methylase Tyw3